MDSQLNPEAKEFIPVSPVSGRAMDLQTTPPFENGTKSPFVNQLLSNFDDAVVAQSPRKGEVSTLLMEDVQIPDNENEFDQEADARPHEVNLLDENFQRIDSPSAKEAMQVDDKLEQGYLDDSQQQQQQQKENQQKEDSFFEEEKHQESDEYKVLESSFEQYSNGFQSKIDDAMNRSFYEGRDGNILENNAANVLNTVQPIPSFEDEQPEANIENGNDKPEVESSEVDLAVVVEPIFVAEEISKVNTEVIQQEEEQQMIESSDNFEAEHIVEEIKGIISENKYVDTELSPTVADFVPSTFQSPPVVEEIIATHTSFKEELIGNLEETIAVETLKVDNLEAPREEIPAVVDAEIQQTELKDIPEVIEAIVQEVLIEEPAKTEPNTEVAVAKSKAPISAAAAPKKTTMTTSSKLAAKPTEVKKAENKPKTATSTLKPALGLASKPPLSKPTSTMKPNPSSTAAAAASRAKPVASIPPIRKPTASSTLAAKTITKTESKPAVKAASTSSVPPKRPVTSAFTARPAPKTTTTVASNGTTEKKITSAPAAARVPAKPTSLTVKSKVTNGTSATTSLASTAKSPLRPARLSTSATSPLKEKVLNKSTSSTLTAVKSPRPATTTSTLKNTLKSSATANAAKPLSAVGIKKPISSTITKKLPVEKTSSTTVIKKSPSATSTKTAPLASKTVKKTTTTVITKKVVNGDIVESSETTTTKVSGDLLASGDMTNGHINGNGLMENGSNDQQLEQAVIEPTGI
jgi:hypothetical protein